MDYIGRSLVADALQEWREQLQTHATVSPLRDLVATRAELIDLRHSHPSGLAQLFASRPTALTSLIRDDNALDSALAYGRSIIDEAERVKAATGAWTAAMAVGTAYWRAASHDVEMPILLRAVELDRYRERDLHITLRNEVWVNPALVSLLRERAAQAGWDAPPTLPAVTVGREFDPRPLWEAVRAHTDLLGESLEVRNRLILGAYDDPEQRLLDDLDDLDSVISASPILAAAAGDRDALGTLGEPLPAFPKGDRDPFGERGIGDLDDVTFAALDLIATGRDVFLEAPPGTDIDGIAAAIGADGAASGRTVAIVGGQDGALKAIGKRLSDEGAGDVVVDGTEAAWNMSARSRLLEAITMGTQPVDDAGVRQAGESLVQARAALHRRFDALHRTYRPWGVSAFEAVQAIVRVTTATPAPQTTARLGADAGAVVADLGFASVAAAIARDLAPEGSDPEVQAADAAAETPQSEDDSWWWGHANPDDGAHLDEALAGFLGRSVPKMRAEAATAAHETGVDEASSFTVWADQVDMFASLRELLETFSPAVFHRSLHDLVAATAPHDSPKYVDLPRRDRRALTRRAAELLRPGRDKSRLHEDLVRAHALALRWRSHCSGGGWPVVPDDYDIYVDHVQRASQEWAVLSPVVASVTEIEGLDEQPWDSVVEHLDRLALGVPGSLESSDVSDLDVDLDADGFAALLQDLRSRSASAVQIRRDLEFAWWAAAFDAIVTADPSLTEYGAIGGAVEEFLARDTAFSAARVGPLMRAAAERRRSAIARHPDMARDLFAALVEGRDASYKELWRDFAPLVTSLRPVVLAKAEQVSHLAPASLSIDVAVVVAGESLALAELVPTLARAKQVVVLGDAHAATRSAVAALATLLPRVTLHAAGQPRDPRVSALLAEIAYGRALPTQPAARGQGALTVNAVTATGLPDADAGVVETTSQEVRAVADYVEEAVGDDPHRTRVVVAGSRTHAEHIRAELTARSAKLAARIPVEAMGEAAGVHCDEVVVSLGFARDTRQGLPTHLGALSEPWGREALVQALVASTCDVTVFTSLDAHAVAELATDDTPGVGDFADLLSAAETPAVAPERPEPAPSDWLLADVAQRLRHDNYPVHVRYGKAADAIPMVVGGRKQPEYTVAIVTDEASAAGSLSLRDRVRRQHEQLNHLGWNVVPLWTLDVFMDPDSAAAEVRAALPENAPEPVFIQESLEFDVEPAPVDEVADLHDDLPVRPEPEPMTLGLSTMMVESAIDAAREPHQPVAPLWPSAVSARSAASAQSARSASAVSARSTASVRSATSVGSATSVRSAASAHSSLSAPSAASAVSASSARSATSARSAVSGSSARSASSAVSASSPTTWEASAPMTSAPSAASVPGTPSAASTPSADSAGSSDSAASASTPSTASVASAPSAASAAKTEAPANGSSQGTGRPLIPTRAWEDEDAAWGDRGSGSRDDEIRGDKPPHW